MSTDTIHTALMEGSFDDLLQRAGIRDFRFHDLRHTFASWYMMNGGDLYELAKILGHSNIKMTERYAKLGKARIAKTNNTAREIWKLLEQGSDEAQRFDRCALIFRELDWYDFWLPLSIDNVVDPNTASLNRLSEILNKADALAGEIANIINNICSGEEKQQALGEASKVACCPLVTDRPHACASRKRVTRKPKPQGELSEPEIELIDPRLDSQADGPISRHEPGILGSAANDSHSADLNSPEGTKVEADPGTVDGVQKPLVSASLAALYNREELYEKVWKTPVRILAREYGVSDVAIAKTCRKLHIPLPGIGYWSKKAAHRPVEPRPPLPVIEIRSQQRTGTSWAPKPTTIPVSEEPLQVSPRLLARYDREELYEKVWTLTMQKVAKEYGVPK